MVVKSQDSVGKGKINCCLQQPFLLAPLAIGQRAYVMAHCPLCVRPSLR